MKEIIKIRQEINKTEIKKQKRSIKPFFFWKDKQNQQTSSQAHQKEKREDPNKENKKRGKITAHTIDT